MSVETLAFQAETKELLRLMIHSLYTEKDIFLRELISNASDALDRLRFESLTNPELLENNDKFEIRLEVDKELKSLTISDSGIGMTRDEVVAHIGTIAKSGTGELKRRLQEEKGEEAKGDAAKSSANIADLIGQFGVGFYSAFMVADKVKLVTRRAGHAQAVAWESEGAGSYTIGDTEKADRGTSITLYLRTPDPDNGIEDYTDTWRISSIVTKHSDFIAYPIILKKEEKDDKGETTEKDETLNSMKPIWKRSPSEVTAEEYTEFYKHVSHDWNDPLKTIHFRAEGTFEYEALLYVPSKAPWDLYYMGSESGGLRLFARRVMIMEKCEDLLPRYLRFIKGVVDGSDLPLNISRQRLQQDAHITRMRKRLTTKVLDTIKEINEKESEKYLTLWAEFGRAFKEGVAIDYDNRDRIVELLLFESSNDPKNLTSLKDYVARMKPEQEPIYYMTGESRALIENSPHLEALKDKGYEVLYMADPVDELVLQHLTEFEGKKLKSVGKGDIDLGPKDEEKTAEFKPLLEFLQKKLDDQVKEVRLSSRLTTSPACLVVGEHEYSPMLERALRKGGAEAPHTKRILELNPKHALIELMRARQAQSEEDPLLNDAAEVLLGLSLLADGSELTDPAKFSKATAEVVRQALGPR